MIDEPDMDMSDSSESDYRKNCNIPTSAIAPISSTVCAEHVTKKSKSWDAAHKY